MKLKERFHAFYEKNELKIDILFFFVGFAFDASMASEIAEPYSLLHQSFYLCLIGLLLYADLLPLPPRPPSWFAKPWEYRTLLLHFMMGTLLSVYSVFFLKSSSFFSSFAYAGLLFSLLVANELKSVRKGKINTKVALYVICVFSFFSVLYPVLLGFVGRVPFFLAVGSTALLLYGAYRKLRRKLGPELKRSFLLPAFGALSLFLLFYYFGLIPPVPLSAENMGIYHDVAKVDGKYVLLYEKSHFWQKGDREFLAEPGDKVYFFAKIFSPARFNDLVMLHWYYKNSKTGWQSTDLIPMHVTGERKDGYRGFSVKKNYSPGEWRVSVETTDAREIGRLYFTLTNVAANPNRAFLTEEH